MAIKRSQKNYSRPRAEVEQAVIDSHSPEKRIEAAVESGGGNKGGFAKPSAFFKVGSDKKPYKKKPQDGGSNGSNGDNRNNNNNGNRAQNQTESNPKSPEPTLPQTDPNPTNAAADTRQPTDRPDRRPKPAAKSADDLRAILAKMTAEHKPTPQAKLQPPEPKKRLPEPARSPATQPKPARQPAAQPKPAQPPSEPARTDLKSALAALMQPSAQPAQPASPSSSADQPRTATPQPTVAIEAVKQPDSPTIGGSRQPAFTPVTHAPAPDPAKVRQILRTSGKERPPGIG